MLHLYFLIRLQTIALQGNRPLKSTHTSWGDTSRFRLSYTLLKQSQSALRSSLHPHFYDCWMTWLLPRCRRTVWCHNRPVFIVSEVLCSASLRRASAGTVADSTRGVYSTAFSGNTSERIVLQLMLNPQLFRHASSFPRKENTGPATFLFPVPLPPSPRCFLPFKENPVALLLLSFSKWKFTRFRGHEANESPTTKPAEELSYYRNSDAEFQTWSNCHKFAGQHSLCKYSVISYFADLLLVNKTHIKERLNIFC